MIYSGARIKHTGEVEVVVSDSGLLTSLDPRNDVMNHSPDGFEWGYAGSGPAQLALAICVHALGFKIGSQPSVYQRFKDRFVQGWGDEWEMTRDEVQAWYLLNKGAK